MTQYKKALSDKPLSNMVEWYREHAHSPLVTALVTCLGTAGLTSLAWGPVVETVRSLGRPVGRRMAGGDREYDEAMDRMRNDSSLRWKIPAAFGLMAAGIPLYASFDPRKDGYGLARYNATVHPETRDMLPTEYNADRIIRGMDKGASFEYGPLNPDMSYLQELDWGRQVSAPTATGLFTNDPHLDNDQYTRHLGTAIVNNAALSNHTSRPTLGNVFDSAVDKIDKKLSFGGLVDVGIRAAVANGAARLFTGALGAVCDLSPKARQSIVDAGTWAGAITSILN